MWSDSEESIGSCVAFIQPAGAGAFREEEKKIPLKTPEKERGNACFFCGQEGHWFKACPLKAKTSPEPCTSSAGDGIGTKMERPRGYQEVRCYCGRPCVVLKSQTERNPGREFYRCPEKLISEKCKFFQWCDEVGLNVQHGFNSPTKGQCAKSPIKPCQQNCRARSLYPVCSCGAGTCIILTMKDGLNAGRKYYACPIKKGQGACNHIQWLDSPIKPSETITNNTGQNKLTSHPVPEVKTPEIDNCCTKDNNISMEEFPSFILGQGVNHVQRFDSPTKESEAKSSFPGFMLVNVDLKEQKMVVKGGADAATNGANPEQMLSNASIVAQSTPVSPKRELAPDNLGAFSPLKKRSLHDGSSPSALREGKCYRCGQQGHWMNECRSPSTSTCFRCGGFGHWQKDCPA